MLKPVIWIGSLALAGMLGYAGHSVGQEYAMQAKRQEGLNNRLAQFKATYETLQGVEMKFVDTYQQVSSNIDVLSLYRTVGLANFTETPPDKITITSVTQIKEGDVELPLFEVCIANDRSKFIMRTRDVIGALSQIQRIASQPDMRFDGLALNQANDTVEITLNSICTLVRTANEEA